MPPRQWPRSQHMKHCHGEFLRSFPSIFTVRSTMFASSKGRTEEVFNALLLEIFVPLNRKTHTYQKHTPVQNLFPLESV